MSSTNLLSKLSGVDRLDYLDEVYNNIPKLDDFDKIKDLDLLNCTKLGNNIIVMHCKNTSSDEKYNIVYNKTEDIYLQTSDTIKDRFTGKVYKLQSEHDKNKMVFTGRHVDMEDAEFTGELLYDLQDDDSSVINLYKYGDFVYSLFKKSSDDTGLFYIQSPSGGFITGDPDDVILPTSPIFIDWNSYKDNTDSRDIGNNSNGLLIYFNNFILIISNQSKECECYVYTEKELKKMNIIQDLLPKYIL